MTIPQAHVRNPISHADVSGFAAGTVIGIVLGAVVVVAIVGSGGTVTVLGAVAYASTGGSIGAFGGEIYIDPTKNSTVEGYIADGSPDTFVGAAREKAARASMTEPKTLVDCHPGSYVIQGSETVFVNRCSSSRRKDGTSCGGFISDGDPTVFTGGDPATLYEYRGAEVYDANLLWRDKVNLGLSLMGLAGAPSTTFGKYLYAGNVVGTGMQAADVVANTAPSTASQLLGGGLAVGGGLDALTDPANRGFIRGAGQLLGF